MTHPYAHPGQPSTAASSQSPKVVIPGESMAAASPNPTVSSVPAEDHEVLDRVTEQLIHGVPEHSPRTAGGWSLARLAANMRQFLKFGIVGGSGTVVNLAVVYLSKRIGESTWGIDVTDIFLPLWGTDFNIRWYNVFTILAFMVANTWNYQLNRMWTFRAVAKVSWLRGYGPFVLTGIGALVVSQIVLVGLMNPTSPIALPVDIFDGSTGLRTPFYWASAISIIVAMPVNFVINKLWTFRNTPKAPVFIEDTPPV